MGRAGEKIRAEVKIMPPETNRFDITGVSAEDGSNIRFKLEKKKHSDTRFFMLHIANTKSEAGRYFDKIILSTTSATSPELTVRVFGIIRD